MRIEDGETPGTCLLVRDMLRILSSFGCILSSDLLQRHNIGPSFQPEILRPRLSLLSPRPRMKVEVILTWYDLSFSKSASVQFSRCFGHKSGSFRPLRSQPQ